MKKESIQEKRLVRRLVRLALEEDLGTRRRDVTSDLLFKPKDRMKAVILAKEELVFCGFPLICEVFRQLDPSVRVEACVTDAALCSGSRREPCSTSGYPKDLSRPPPSGQVCCPGGRRNQSPHGAL